MANQVVIKDKTIQIGDTIKVYHKIKEKDKERIQIFNGIVIRIKGHGENKTFTVRKIAIGGIGVEKIWPVNSPWISKLEVLKKGSVRRSKLYYLRDRVGKKATRVKSRRLDKSELEENQNSNKKESVKKPKQAKLTKKK
jgi:large subunit ribosomal protein L19